MGNCYWNFKIKAQRSTAKMNILIRKNDGETIENGAGESREKRRKSGTNRRKKGETKRITLENQGKIHNS